MFLVIEGPDGVGKSTLVAAVAEELTQRAVSVQVTREPTDTELGRLIRSDRELRGRALALACAADRQAHLELEILPALNAGRWVVCDRYVQSSLVLQRLDGLHPDEIWSYNRHVVPPDRSVYLTEDTDVVRERLRARGALSRLEALSTTDQLVTLYEQTRQFLDRLGWNQLVVASGGRTPADLARYVLAHVERQS